MLNILTVEDSLAIRKILQRMLRQTDIPVGEIYEAADGREALTILAQKTVNLVFTDINMPNMDGMELLRCMASSTEWRHIPVIMLTTEAGESVVMRAVELGAVGYIRKPFNLDQVQSKLESAVGALRGI